MAIPAMISDFSKQQLNYGAAVGQSLAQLGQQIGQQLAMKEYQRQASAALPAMQASYKEAFNKIGRGDYAGGYMQMMDTNLQSGALQNPFLAKYAEQAGAMAELAGKQTQSEAWRRLQAGYGGGAAGLPAGPSGADLAAEAMGMPAATSAGQPMPMEVDGGELPIDLEQTPAEVLPALGAAPEMAATPDEQAQKAQEQFDKLPVYKQAAVANTGAFDALPPQGKSQALESSLQNDPGAKKYDNYKIDLSEFGVNVGELSVPKPGEKVRIKMTASGTTKDPTVRKTFSRDFIKVGEDQFKDNTEYIKKLKDASSSLKKMRPESGMPTFVDIFKQNGGIFNATFAPNDENGFDMIPSEGAAPISITEDAYEKIKMIQDVPAIADTGIDIKPFKQMKGRVSVTPAPTQERKPLNTLLPRK